MVSGRLGGNREEACLVDGPAERGLDLPGSGQLVPSQLRHAGAHLLNTLLVECLYLFNWQKERERKKGIRTGQVHLAMAMTMTHGSWKETWV